MVRQGLLAFLVIGLVACSQDVDDPATFTAGNSAAATTTGGENEQTSTTTDPGNTSVGDNGNGQTSTTGDAADTSDGGMNTSSGGGGNGNCGNGAIDAGEQCDGMDLQGFDCAALGLSGGTLACDPMMCTFDTSMCNAGPGTSG